MSEATTFVAAFEGLLVIVRTNTFALVMDSVSMFVEVPVNHPVDPRLTLPRPVTVTESLDAPPSVNVTDTAFVPVPSQPETKLDGATPLASE